MPRLPRRSGSTQETIPNSGGVGKCLKPQTVGIRLESVEKPATGDEDNAKKVSSMCGIEGLVKESHAHTNVVDAQNAGCGAVWNLAARNAEFKLQIRHQGGVARHGGPQAHEHVRQSRRLRYTRTIVSR